MQAKVLHVSGEPDFFAISLNGAVVAEIENVDSRAVTVPLYRCSQMGEIAQRRQRQRVVQIVIGAQHALQERVGSGAWIGEVGGAVVVGRQRIGLGSAVGRDDNRAARTAFWTRPGK